MTREYIKKEREGATVEELEQFTLGSLRKAVFDGDVRDGSLMAGQVSGQLKEIKPIADIFAELYAQYEAVIAKRQ